MTITGLLLLIHLLNSCSKNEEKPTPDDTIAYETVPLQKPITAGVIDEVSGIAPGYNNAGKLWTIEDSDRPSELGLLDPNGTVLKKVVLNGIVNRDWEDIATGPGPEAGVNYVYVAETGDNASVYNDYAIFRMKEPQSADTKVDAIDKIRFVYPDGSHDAEAILLDPSTKDLYVITKRDAKSKLYKLAYPYKVDESQSLTFITDLPYNLVTAASISKDGKEILVRTYGVIYYYTVSSGKSVGDVLAGSYKELQHQAEPQGESICFAGDQSGFYTISEKLLNAPVNLNFYAKK
jgi:hypothetical protein